MFEIFKDRSGGFRFRLKAKTGETLLSSESYTQKTNCQKGVGSVRRNAKNEDRFEIKSSSNNKWFFNLKAGNGQIVASSEIYNNEDAAKAGIKKTMEDAITFEIKDLSK